MAATHRPSEPATPGLPRPARDPRALAGDRLDPASSSGALLFLIGIPALLSGVGSEPRLAESFAQLRAGFGSPVVKLLLLLLVVWAYLHHFCAGIRHLLFDVRIGGELGPARRSAAIVLVVSLLLTVTIGESGYGDPSTAGAAP